MSIDTSTFPVSIADIRRAADYLAPVAVRTPLLESPYLNAIAGRRLGKCPALRNNTASNLIRS